MIIMANLLRRNAVTKYVVNSLYVEGLFDFGVGSKPQMNNNGGRNEQRKEYIRSNSHAKRYVVSFQD
jgi:hypothetical protein